MNKELEELKKMKIGNVELLDDGTSLHFEAYELDSPYTDVIRVYGGVLYRTMIKDKKSVHSVFVPLAGI
ncbi:MAG: hypothetical protein ILP07_09515 [Treponema sp.]|nr:hypothetical protein [Treponema sp.]